MNNEVHQQGLGARKRIVGAAESLAQKLNQEIEKGNDDVAFMIALFLAGLNDFLDIFLVLTGVGLIPGVTWATGLFLGGFLFFFMLGKGWLLKWRLRIMYWVFGWLIGGLPAFNTLPISTLLVLYAWRLAKKRKDRATEKLGELHNMTDYEVGLLNNNIGLLEESPEAYRAQVTSNKSRASQINKKNEEARSRITPLPPPRKLSLDKRSPQISPHVDSLAKPQAISDSQRREERNRQWEALEKRKRDSFIEREYGGEENFKKSREKNEREWKGGTSAMPSPNSYLNTPPQQPTTSRDKGDEKMAA